MSHVTTCTVCSKLYEESSEEQANAPDRKCTECFHEHLKYRACGICGVRDIPRGVDWPWWMWGYCVHGSCAQRVSA